MSRRSLPLFLILNALVTFAVMLLFNMFLTGQPSAAPTPPVQMLQVVVTATPDPNQPPAVTVVVVTATGSRLAAQPTTGLDPNVPTLDPAQLPPSLNTPAVSANSAGETSTPAQDVISTDPNGCPLYTIKAGDFPGRVANQFGVAVGDLLAANDLTEQDATRLQIGQTLVIPVNGCGLKPTGAPTETPTKIVVPTKPATATLAPTSASTELEVVQVINAGDITSEGVEIRNRSQDVVEIANWTLSDGQGNTFTFPSYQMFGGRRVIIYTRAGSNTPVALFWGLTKPVWNAPNAVITITDDKGVVKLQTTASR